MNKYKTLTSSTILILLAEEGSLGLSSGGDILGLTTSNTTVGGGTTYTR